MRPWLLILTPLVLSASCQVLAADAVVGRYRLTAVQDAAGELLLRSNGKFEYALAYGALDENAKGCWIRHGKHLSLTTLPKPVPPVFRTAPRSADAPNAPTLRVTWPDGRGTPGIDFRIGFDSGNPVIDYTQEDGWTMPPDEHRIPRWIELVEPIYGVVSPRYPIDSTAKGTLNFVIVPNNIGVVDFDGMVVDVSPDELIIHRGAGEMKFVREKNR